MDFVKDEKTVKELAKKAWLEKWEELDNWAKNERFFYEFYKKLKEKLK